MKLGKLKVGQLRKELSNRGLDTTGTRPALLKRLREALDRDGAAAQEPAVQEPDELPTHYPLNPRAETSPLDGQTAQPPQAAPAAEPEPEPEPAAAEPAPPQEAAKAEGDSPQADVDTAGGGATPARATGSLVRASEEAMEERLRRRRERFGAVELPVPGSKRKKTNESEEAKTIEEEKARRAAKFGPVNAPLVGGVSKEEHDRRLKRQRRFQSVGNTTAV